MAVNLIFVVRANACFFFLPAVWGRASRFRVVTQGVANRSEDLSAGLLPKAAARAETIIVSNLPFGLLFS